MEASRHQDGTDSTDLDFSLLGLPLSRLAGDARNTGASLARPLMARLVPGGYLERDVAVGTAPAAPSRQSRTSSAQLDRDIARPRAAARRRGAGTDRQGRLSQSAGADHRSVRSRRPGGYLRSPGRTETVRAARATILRREPPRRQRQYRCGGCGALSRRWLYADGRKLGGVDQRQSLSAASL